MIVVVISSFYSLPCVWNHHRDQVPTWGSPHAESTGITASRPIHHPRDSFAMAVRIPLERANALRPRIRGIRIW